MPERLELRARSSETVRCAVCHGDFDSGPAVCASCGACFHPDCRSPLGRCTTLGCKAGKPWEPLVRRPVRSEVDWIAQLPGLVFMGLALAVSLATGMAFTMAETTAT